MRLRMSFRSAAPPVTALFVCLALSAPAPAERARVEVYRPKARPAAELAELLDPLLGSEAFAMADPGSGALILHGSPASLARARELLRDLDTAPRQFLVESRIASREAVARSGAGVRGWLELGPLRVGVLGSGDAPARLAAGAWTRETGAAVGGSLRIREGAEAELWTGTTTPLLLLGAGGPRTLRTAAMSGFRVRPRGLGDGRVDLELVAIRSRPGPGGAVQETGASVRVQLEPGEWLAVAGASQTDESSSRSLLAAGHAESASESLILVRVTPEAVPASPD